MIKANSNKLKYFKQTAACFRSTILDILGILDNLGISLRGGILTYIRHFRHFSSSHFSQSGLAYVAILVLLAVVSTLAMAFLFKAGTLRATTANRLAGMQAGYLAEAAANHALWRMLNEPGFNPATDKYYMHNLGTGRYGYKVRKPTLTTFATVATVGAVGNAVVKQSYVPYIKAENILTTYDKTAVETVPKYKRMFGASWSAQADTVNDGVDPAQWMVLRGYPKTDRKEFVMGTLDNLGHINFAVWQNGSWGNQTEFTTTAGPTHRAFDIAYETLSGRALVLGRYDGTTAVKYKVWNGSTTSWSATQNAFSIAGGTLTYLTMASRPNSNDILIATVTDSNVLQLFQWEGNMFSEVLIMPPEPTPLPAAGAYGKVDIVYEQISGHALIIWSRSGDVKFYYAVYDGTFLSPPTEGRNITSPFIVVRAAADPASDSIFIATINSSNGLYAALWDGNTWVNSRQLDTSVIGTAGQFVDVAWERTGQDVLVAWTSSGSSNNISYLSWQKGTSLPAPPVRLGPALEAQGGRVRLLPVSGTQKIILLTKTGAGHLRYSLWTGSGFSGNPGIQLESSLSSGTLNFDAAETGIAYTGGAG